MNYTKEKLERFCQHWQGQSINDQLANREPTDKITVEMDVSIWERIWSEDATQEMYEALKAIMVATTDAGVYEMVERYRFVLAKVEGKDDTLCR